MSATYWSEQHPSEPGWYWYRTKNCVMVVRVREQAGRLVYSQPGWRWSESIGLAAGVFSERISEPEGYR